MKNPDLKKARKAINTIAEKENLTETDVRSEMKAAIAEGMRSADPAVKAMWEAVPSEGDVPEPEELIAWLAEQVRKKLKT